VRCRGTSPSGCQGDYLGWAEHPTARAWPRATKERLVTCNTSAVKRRYPNPFQYLCQPNTANLVMPITELGYSHPRIAVEYTRSMWLMASCAPADKDFTVI
jgi:hypothetical protein